MSCLSRFSLIFTGCYSVLKAVTSYLVTTLSPPQPLSMRACAASPGCAANGRICLQPAGSKRPFAAWFVSGHYRSLANMVTVRYALPLLPPVSAPAGGPRAIRLAPTANKNKRT